MSESPFQNDSSEILNSLLAALSEIAVCADKDGNIQAYNIPWLEYVAANPAQPPAQKNNLLLFIRENFISGPGDDLNSILSAFSTVAEGNAQSITKTYQCRHGGSSLRVVAKFSSLRMGSQTLVLIRLEQLKSLVPQDKIITEVPQFLYQSLLDDLPVPLNICDQDMRCVWVNRTIREQYKLGIDDVIGKKIDEIPGLRNFDRRHELRQKCFATGREQSEIITISCDGRDMIFDARYIPVLHENGQVQFVIGVNRDITRKVQSQNARTAAHDLLNDVLERMPVGFIATDAHFNILRANQRACDLFAHAKEDLIGQHINVLIPPEFHEHHRKYMADFAASGATSLLMDSRREVYAQRSDGVVFPIMASVFKMALGTFPLYCAMIVDLSKIKETEQQLADHEFRMQQMQRHEALGLLAGNIAHDFNNLMAIVLGYSDIVQETEQIPEDVLGMMGEIKKAVHRGAALTRQILAYAKHQTLEVKAMDMHGLLQDNLAMIQAALTTGVKCILRLDAKSSFVEIDENQIMQVIINLAVNARDAMPSGGEFTIATNVLHLDNEYFTTRAIQPQPGEYLYITIADSGTGIPKEVLPRIFDPYFSTKPRDKGTGLGLSVVYGIMKQHGGLIFCDSSPGGGTVFELLLPLCKESLVAQTDQESGDLTDRRDNSGIVILVVDDEEALRNLIVARLTSAGFQVHSAENGRAALAFMDTFAEKIDIVLSDIMMPEMTGLEMAEEAQLLQPDTIFIFMSGYSKELIITKKAKDDFRLLTKPFLLETLVEEIKRVLREKKNLELT